MKRWNKSGFVAVTEKSRNNVSRVVPSRTEEADNSGVCASDPGKTDKLLYGLFQISFTEQTKQADQFTKTDDYIKLRA